MGAPFYFDRRRKGTPWRENEGYWAKGPRLVGEISFWEAEEIKELFLQTFERRARTQIDRNFEQTLWVFSMVGE